MVYLVEIDRAAAALDEALAFGRSEGQIWLRGSEGTRRATR